MSARRPPLSALRVFEAAARHLSFTRAAEELHVTQAAVSHQMKRLEARLGQPLFRRRNRALLLTDAGQRYAAAVRRAFEIIDAATDDLGPERPRRQSLTISALASFTARWLVPRLGRFIQRFPEIDVLVSPSDHLIDFARERVDVALRYGAGRYPGCFVQRMMSEALLVVCSPALLAGPRPLAVPADLAHQVLLHDEPGYWRRWLAGAGVTGVDLERGHEFTDSSNLIQAAVAGQGVALTRSVLARDELIAGRLVTLFDGVALPVESAYYFVCPAGAEEEPKIAAFRTWVFEVIESERDAP